jgi:hypothetical protein
VDDFFSRTGDMLLDRVHGPFSFRFVLQPLTAAVIAGRAAVRDARAGRPAYGWAVLTNRAQRRELLRQGWRDVARVFFFAVAMDLLYEVIVFHRIYPGQSLIVAAVLALLPYPFIREVCNRFVCRWFRNSRSVVLADPFQKR